MEPENSSQMHFELHLSTFMSAGKNIQHQCIGLGAPWKRGGRKRSRTQAWDSVREGIEQVQEGYLGNEGNLAPVKSLGMLRSSLLLW